ncbi:carbonic anhydrase 4b [Alosa alosa]|uniref:carbonic anhydrase 4b n=1 Tax=Alosa sapidissima TaxID=34773 RepID=UPI001C081DFB|nr:carbonic anhydrase 4b [Alosa sapidissima]XP_048119835.1 carbonic anhydrase 4b [Alosa alosa]
MRMHILYGMFFLFSTLKTSSGAEWCYQSQVTCAKPCQGPSKWTEVAMTCGGQAQSPINIVTKKARTDERLKPLHYTGYQFGFHSDIINNGHYVQVSLPDSAKIDGGNLESTYKTLQLHFHWGAHGGPGSEHTIDGEQYPMEMHIVHIKQEYHSISEALKDKTGVAVLGFFYQESGSSNKKYESIVNALKYITQPGNNTTVKDLSLDMLIPSQENLTTYYRYQGSLTTPDCDESVVWTVFENAIPLSKEQLSAFSQLSFADGKNMTGTYRPVQPLNGREVYRSGSVVVWVNTVVLLSSVLAAVGLSLPD